MNLAENFKKPATLADSVEECILQYVHHKQLAPGDLLPKEEEIASQLNVSRHIVREGISGLKTLGVIESRKRKGMFIRHQFNAFESVRKLAHAHLFSPEECRQFMQIRVIMELGMATYIWEKHTAEDIAELRKIINQEDASVVQNEIDFHSKLFSIGGNSIANQFQNILVSAFDRYHHQPQKIGKNLTEAHNSICDCLENGTVEEFRKLMEKHFETYLKEKES